MKKQGLCVGGCGYRGKCACGTGFEKPKTKPKKLSDHYWADFVHLNNGRMVAVIEGFDTLEQAIELVEKAQSLSLRYSKFGRRKGSK